MSGYRHSGMIRDDYEAREKLYDMAVFIEERWPDQYPVLCRDLRDLGDTVSDESAAPARPDEEPT